jgi:predicted Zn-ribbon and HTH transcriptional regulator
MHPEVISDKPGKCPKCGMEIDREKINGVFIQNIRQQQN